MAVTPGIPLRTAALVTAAGLALTPAAAQADAAPVAADSTPDAAVAGSVQWTPCPSDAHPTKQCATVRVPRVYGRPDLGKIRIAIARVPASGTPQQRIGSLFWDAGGPGGASTGIIDMMADRMSPQVRARFDFVAFDPRGIGASTPALERCGQPWPVLPARDPTPSWYTAQRLSASLLAPANRACARRARGFVGTMGTNTVVTDLNRLRRAVGDSQLTFWGTSYGTRIGYVYAYRYPQRVRAMLLDGNIDPSAGYAGLPGVGGSAQDLALRFMKHNYPAGHRAIVRTAAALLDRPIRLAGGPAFSRADWLNFVGGFVAFQEGWPQLTRAAAIVRLARGTGTQAQEARAALARWRSQPNSNEGGGFSVVNCLDYADHLTRQQQGRIATVNSRKYPVFGGSLSLQYAIGCAGLRGLRPDPVPLITTARQRARVAGVPVLLANATNDGSTPLAWAKQMQRVFGRPMVKYRSGQHVIWGAVVSACVNRPLDRFVISGVEPRADRTCRFVFPGPPLVGPGNTVVAAPASIR